MTERTRIPREQFFYTDLTLKCRVGYVVEIRDLLEKLGERARRLREMLAGTPFGPWLELSNTGGDPMLVHMFLQLEVEVDNADPDELYFDVFGHAMRFGRLEFCLITGLLFGPTPSLPLLPEDSFVRRVWPGHSLATLKLRIVVNTMKGDLWALSDEDAIRVCLVVMVEMVFMGREWSQSVTETVLRAVEDLNEFNRYPWGSHIWQHTYKQMHRAIARRPDKLNKMTMCGFTYAFKIWILEMFPICRQNFTLRTDRFIRGTRWDRGVSLNKQSCLAILNSATTSRFAPLANLLPTDAERETPWYRDSSAFIEREATRRRSKRARRSSPSLFGSSSSTDEDDEDAARRDHSFAAHDRYEAPPRSSHLCMPPPDPYQVLSITPISYAFGQGSPTTFATTSTPSFPQSFGMSEEGCYTPQMTTTYDMTGPSYVTSPTDAQSGSSDVTPPTYTQNGDYYEATLTIKARISIAKDIFVKLRESNTRFTLFRDTCFGPWLDIRSTNGDSLLIHLILQTQFFPEGARADEMWFRIRGHELRFGREEFCLITGLRFGPVDALHERPANPFRDRVFPHIPTHQHVKGSDLWSVFTSRAFARISDLDAVRICLLLLLEVGFSGRQPHSVVAGFLLRLVEDLDAWNRYPWGSYLWGLTHPQLKTALPRRQHRVGVRADRIAYTLTGFVFAFKIWIFETFPVARRFASRSDAIPRAIAWQWTQTIMWDTCLTFLDVDDPLTVTSTDVERETDWWRDSQRFFDNIADDFQPPTKRGRSYSPPRPPRPPISTSTWVGASSPAAVATAPTPLEQRVAALEQAVRDLQAGQHALEVGQRDLEAGQRATQAGQRAILESMARLHETVQHALEANPRTKVRSKDTRPIVIDDDVAKGGP